jgi:hypothetical protein
MKAGVFEVVRGPHLVVSYVESMPGLGFDCQTRWSRRTSEAGHNPRGRG